MVGRITVAGSNDLPDEAFDFSVVGGIVGLLLVGGISRYLRSHGGVSKGHGQCQQSVPAVFGAVAHFDAGNAQDATLREHTGLGGCRLVGAVALPTPRWSRLYE